MATRRFARNFTREIIRPRQRGTRYALSMLSLTLKDHEMAKDEATSGGAGKSREPKKGMPGGSGGKGQTGTDAGKTKSKTADNDKYGSTGSKQSGGTGSSQGSGGGSGGTRG